ncbi:DUF3105 domain-containing protein [Antrihabitans cavernicola]|uniref:DUF3105 domain-containing protein n=1 Tax=Antrihabitans cavernicola TaxID=2495913 RepID=A0A5A7S5I5_9NOCA|nr:DUF3105 domain-containing protein [Spelaeibacter cavernicola]KAA0018063.1 DUF3105 domain-containing protein [Spelaeibacter cavernicola]
MPSGPESRSPQGKTGAKSAKAIKAATRKSSTSSRGKGLPKGRQIPWMTVGAVVVVLALIGLLAYNLVPKYHDQAEAQKFTPSDTNKDPSSGIDGVVKVDYPAGIHVGPTQRVAYDKSPPFGGPHDATWATCTGNVYPKAIRTENAVHSLEHGAIWIAYNPDKVDAAGVDTLKKKVDGQAYTLMSPYPGLDKAISLQSWGHQLKLDSPDDKRIGEFIAALRLNKNTYPEVGASCSTIPGQGSFDTNNPPPFDATPPGPDAVPMDGKGIAPDAAEQGGAAAGGLPGGMPGGLPGGLPGGAQLPPELQQPAPGAPAAPAPAPAPAP